jgi:hypothetical protein
VVATHRVLPITDVIKLLKKERFQQSTNSNASTEQEEENGEKTANESNNACRKSEKQKVCDIEK